MDPGTRGIIAPVPSHGMAPGRKRLMYWSTQLAVWACYVCFFLLLSYLNDTLAIQEVRVAILVAIIGLGSSHALRGIILRNQWLSLHIGGLLPRIVLGSLVMGTVALATEALGKALLPHTTPHFATSMGGVLSHLINWVILLVLWCMGYLAYHYVAKIRQEEIRNLRLETAARDNQLNNLRAQLNPHFMFNALNGIRALIDEDPAQAKRAITQLSAILRNAMSTVKRRTVPLGEEIDIVKAYLALEAMRYEERLRVSFAIDPALEREPVPPMLLQTLVENAVRHGVARLPGGGDLHIAAKGEADCLHLMVRNSGQYIEGKVNGSGIGLRNTRRRLELLYGDRAEMRIGNVDGMVETLVRVPRINGEVPVDTHA